MTDFGRKGGTSPTVGAKALTFKFTFPDGTAGTKRSFDKRIRYAVGYSGPIFAAVYQHAGVWYVAGLTCADKGGFPRCEFVPATLVA